MNYYNWSDSPPVMLYWVCLVWFIHLFKCLKVCLGMFSYRFFGWWQTVCSHEGFVGCYLSQSPGVCGPTWAHSDHHQGGLPVPHHGGGPDQISITHNQVCAHWNVSGLRANHIFVQFAFKFFVLGWCLCVSCLKVPERVRWLGREKQRRTWRTVSPTSRVGQRATTAQDTGGGRRTRSPKRSSHSLKKRGPTVG